MDNLNLPLSPTILGMNYLGDVVFAISGALTAGRHKMDIVGYVLIGTITGIGGGTLRDLLLGREVWCFLCCSCLYGDAHCNGRRSHARCVD